MTSDRPQPPLTPARPPSATPAPSATTVEAEPLFDAFISCKTTLENLSYRAAALGMNISGSAIAAHLIGKSPAPAAAQNIIAAAINARLLELSLPARAPAATGQKTDNRAPSFDHPSPVSDGAASNRRLLRRWLGRL